MNSTSRNGSPQQIQLRQLPFGNEVKPHQLSIAFWALFTKGAIFIQNSFKFASVQKCENHLPPLKEFYYNAFLLPLTDFCVAFIHAQLVIFRLSFRRA